jgi:hypothetical protein
MAIRVTTGLSEQLSNLIPGQNPTSARLTKLLQELSELRAARGQGPVTAEEIAGFPPGDADIAPLPDPDTDPTLVSAADANGIKNMLEDERPIKKLPDEPVRTLSAEEQLAIERAVNEQLRLKLAEAEAGIVPSEGAAIASGKLPVPSTAPTLGSRLEERVTPGRWTTSPLGPKVHFIVCGCGHCSPRRVYHWYCVVCKSGPWHYQQKYPHFNKTWLWPGSVEGINHPVCSEPCRVQYQSQVDQIVARPGGIHPGRLATAPDSD